MAETRVPRGWCPDCWEHQALRKDGRLRAHPQSSHCPGSGIKPTHLWISQAQPMEPVVGETRAAFYDAPVQANG